MLAFIDIALSLVTCQSGHIFAAPRLLFSVLFCLCTIVLKLLYFYFSFWLLVLGIIGWLLALD